MDDFEIEVSNLWEDAPPDWDARDDDTDDDSANDAIRTTETIGGKTARWRSVRSPLAPRLTRRDKVARAGVAMVAVLFASVFLIATSAPVRRGLGSVVAGSPLAGKNRTASGDETVYFENGVPWGTLWLDGHRVRQSASQLFGSLQVGKGHHTLTYSDPPFPKLSCHFDMPISRTNTCPLEVSPSASAVMSGIYVPIVDLGATPDRIPSSSREDLVNAADGALRGLSSSTLLLPGSSYLDVQGKPEVAARPLLATLHFRINTDPSVVAPYMPGQQLCSQICFLGDGSYSPDTWGLLALAQVSWSYAVPDGPTVVANAPAGRLTGGSRTLVALDVSWNGAWQVTARPGNDQYAASPICDVAQALLPPITRHNGTEPPYTQRQVPTSNGANGCLIVTQLTKAGAPTGPAYVLYRFGILLAVNEAARTLYPSLPVAGPYEQGLMRQILGPGGFG